MNFITDCDGSGTHPSCSYPGPHKHCCEEITTSKLLLPEYHPSSEDPKKRLTEEEVEFRSAYYFTIGGCGEAYSDDDERWSKLGNNMIPGEVCPWCAMQFNEIPLHSGDTLGRMNLSHLNVENHSLADL